MNTKLVMIIATYLHVLGVGTYLGGSLVMELVLGPAQKFIPPAQAMVVGKKSADRFLVVAWVALGLIAASGVLRLFTQDNESLLYSERLLDTDYGRTLLTMMSLWAVLVVNGLIMTFVLRPRLAGRVTAQAGAGQAQAQQQSMARAATWVNRLARADLGIVLVVAFLGASLRFGGVG